MSKRVGVLTIELGIIWSHKCCQIRNHKFIVTSSGFRNGQTYIMGKLNIAHHKSYHPYRRDNIEKVRKDEEEARQKEAREEGRMMLAVRQFVLFHSTNICLTCFYRTQRLALTDYES